MAKGRKRKKQQAEAARATGSKKKAKLPDDPSPPQQQHRVRVLASAERFAALLEILNAPSAEPRAAGTVERPTVAERRATDPRSDGQEARAARISECHQEHAWLKTERGAL